MTDSYGPTTRAIHAGGYLDPSNGAVIPPIYLSTTYAPEAIGQLRGGYDYGRGTNPTRDLLQTQIAALESDDPTARGLTFASGLAAETALIMAAAQPGAHLVIGNDVYGGTYRLIAKVFGRWNVEHTVVDMSDLEQVRAAVAARPTALLWVETPTNPLMKIADISALAEIAHAQDALLVVDNTFATPYLQRPLELGADVVVHSTTKYMGGHSDTIGGAVVTTNQELADAVQFQQYAAGASNAPFDAYLVTRGLKTLGVRMDRHIANATRIAAWLESREEVSQVLYPGLESHPQYELAAQQMRGPGGMVSFRLAGGAAVAKKLAESTQLFQLAESLGGVESLLNYPAEMTHASVAGTDLAVPDDLIRLSVGIEDVEDLIADLQKGFSRLSA